MANETVKVNAIVARTAKSGESDSILTMLSPEIGKFSIIAKGARSLRYHSKGAVQPLCYSSFVLKKLRSGFYSLVSAEVKESFSLLSSDVVLLSYGIYFAALCEMCLQENMEAQEEVRLLLNTLYVLCRRADAAPLIKAVFEIKFSELFGIMGQWSSLCPCGSTATCFSIDDGEMRCTAHQTPGCIKMSSGACALGEYICENSLRDALFANGNISHALELSTVTERFLAHHMGNLPKALSYLHSIEKKMQ